MPPGSTCSTRAARNRPARCACERTASGCSSDRPVSACASSPRPRSDEWSRSLARSDRRSLIVDSIQTATVEELDGPPGSVGQVRESALRLTELAKGDGIAVVLVGHVTKEGEPRRTEDAGAPRRRGALARGRASRRPAPAARDQEPVRVDGRGRRVRDGRARACSSCRTRRARSWATSSRPASGSVVAATLEGSRALLVEVQALVTAGGPDAARARSAGSTRTGSRC